MMNINSHYTILCGLFQYNPKLVNENELWDTYSHWQNRINRGDYKSTYNYLNTAYYDGYLNNIFPEIRHDKSNRDDLDPKFLNHLTFKSYIEKQYNSELVINQETKVEFIIEFADLYLFPNGIGIFSIKCTISNEEIKLDEVSSFINRIRQLQSKLIINGNEKTLVDYINNELLYPLDLKEDWGIYNPQLKSYSIIDLKEEVSDTEMNYLLYDMGNVVPLGSGNGKGMFAPSHNYLNDQMSNNKLSVFKNWTAIALFDTFTRISSNFPDTFKSWEYDYFQIYIHCLHIKFYMYLTNTRISDVTAVTRETEKIRDNFIEFINDYYQTHISYKFLPDLIQDKLLYALEIHSEVQMMETKIKRINEHAQEKRERNMNFVLIVITFLNVFGLIYSMSGWIENLGIEKKIVYPWLSLSLGFTIIASIYILFRIRKK